MKTISIVIPTYNEEENIPLIPPRVRALAGRFPEYRFEILFIDNCSADRTRERIHQLCEHDASVKAIFNAKNFGFTRSTFYGLTQATGDAVILMFADMQDPPETIDSFIRKWEEGYKIVVGVKNKSDESRLMYFVRRCYYSLLKKISDVDHIPQFNGFGLYDASFITILQNLPDSFPYLRGIVAELGYKIATVQYKQQVRKFGKSKFNIFKLYDVAMLGITSYSKTLLRCATLLGAVLSAICVVITLITLVIKLLYWDYFSIGTSAVIIGIFFVGSIQMLFLGILGEYVLSISTRVMRRPLVIEEQRLNCGGETDVLEKRS